jgi:predicted XRE-type DNA-binding protein
MDEAQMLSKKISLFSPFDLQHGSHIQAHQQAKNVLKYAEGRFRQALGHIVNAHIQQQKWMQQTLSCELVCNLIQNICILY